MALTPRDGPPEARPRRTWRRRLALLAAILLLGVGGVVGFKYSQGRTELASAIAAADAMDPHWRIADYEAHRKPVDDANNSALVLLAGYRARKMLSRDQRDDLEACLKAIDAQPTVRLDQRQQIALKRLLSQHDKSLPEFRKIAEMPWGRYPIRANVGWVVICMDDEHNCNDEVDALKLDLLSRVESEDVTGAATDLHAMINACRSLGDEPFASSVVMRARKTEICLSAVQRYLAQLQADDAILAKLQAHFDMEEREPLLQRAANANRGFGFQWFEYIKTDPIAVNWSVPESVEDYVAFHLPGYTDGQQAGVMKLMNRFCAISSRDIHDQRELTAQWEKDVARHSAWIRLAVWEMVKCAEAFSRSRAQLRAMILAVAAERYRLNMGRWPAALEDLVAAKLIGAVPLDPYDGKPMKYRETPTGRVIYSIGKDLLDNGGDVDPAKQNKSEGDIGYWLYDVKARRSEPRPETPPTG